MRISLAAIVTLFVGLATLSPTEFALAAPAAGAAYTDPTKADEDFPFQGEYAGEVTHDGQPMKVGVQVVAMKRIRVGRVPLAGLPVGQWRYLLPYERF